MEGAVVERPPARWLGQLRTRQRPVLRRQVDRRAAPRRVLAGRALVGLDQLPDPGQHRRPPPGVPVRAQLGRGPGQVGLYVGGAQPGQLGDDRRVQRPAVGQFVAGELVARDEDVPDPAGQDRPLRGGLLRAERGPVDRRVVGLVLFLRSDSRTSTSPRSRPNSSVTSCCSALTRGARSSDTAAARSVCRRLVCSSCSATVASCAATAATCSPSRPVVARSSRIRRAFTNDSASSWRVAEAVGSRGAPSPDGGVVDGGWPPVMTQPRRGAAASGPRGREEPHRDRRRGSGAGCRGRWRRDVVEPAVEDGQGGLALGRGERVEGLRQVGGQLLGQVDHRGGAVLGRQPRRHLAQCREPAIESGGAVSRARTASCAA